MSIRISIEEIKSWLSEMIVTILEEQHKDCVTKKVKFEVGKKIAENNKTMVIVNIMDDRF